MKNFKYKYKKELVIFLSTLVLFGFAYFKSDRVEQRVNDLVILKGDDEILLGGSTLFAQNASVQLNLAFFGEIKPDGATCGVNEILKRTGANNWDCAADNGGSVASNSLGFGAFVDSLVLDANLTIASTSNNYTIDFLDTRVDIADTTFLSNGNVGIGTTSPNRTLSVSGTASISSDLFLESTLQGGNVTGAATAYNRFGTDTTSHAGSIAASNDLLISGDLEVNGSAAFDGGLIGTTASFSGVFEFTNYASASKYYGGGLTDCDAATSKLLWDTTNGVFSCGTDDDIPDQTDYGNLAGGAGIDQAVVGTLTFDATELEALTWGAGGNATNIWTFNLTAGDPTLTWTGSGASFSLNFETLGYASASKQFGSTLSDCDSNGSQLLWSDTGLFSCQTLADADIPDTITISGGTIGSNNISAASTWTTLGTLTIGDNGDNIVIDSNTWDISGAGVGSGFTGFTSTGDIDLGGAELEISNGTGFTFDTVGEAYFDTTDFQIQIASASANSPRVIPTMQKLWSFSIASTSTEFLSGGRLPLTILRDKYNLSEIHCGTDVAATTVVVNISNMAGTYDTETITADFDGQSDTSIDTNSSYAGFTTVSSSLEIGTVTGSPDWLSCSIYGLYLPE